MTTDSSVVGWVVSDSLKLLVMSVLMVATILQLKTGTPVTAKRHIHWLNFICGVIIITWLSNLHGVAGQGWIAYLILSDAAIAIEVLTGLYTAYVVTCASYATSKLSSKLPLMIGGSFTFVAVCYIICHILSVALTISNDDYRFSLLRHVANSLVLFFVSIYTGILIFRLKRMLRSLTDTLSEGLDPDDGSPVEAANDDKIQTNLTRILLFLAPAFGFGIVALVHFAYETERGPSDYSELLHREQQHYHLATDIAGCWSIVLAHFFFVYYAWINLNVPHLCCFPERTRLDSDGGYSVTSNRSHRGSSSMGIRSERITEDYSYEIKSTGSGEDLRHYESMEG